MDYNYTFTGLTGWYSGEIKLRKEKNRKKESC